MKKICLKNSCQLWRKASLQTVHVDFLYPERKSCGFKTSRYVWTWKFLYPERKSWWFENIRIRRDRAYAINHDDDDENDRKPELVFKWTKQQLCMSITLFNTFRWRPLHEFCTNMTWNLLMRCLMDWRTWTYENKTLWERTFCRRCATREWSF